MTSVETVSIVIAAVSVVIGVINSIRSNRRADEQRQIELKTQELALQTQKQALETRQAELFMHIYNWWNTKATAEQYGRIRYSYDIKNVEDWMRETGYDTGKVTDFNLYSDVQSMANFFEGIGVLVQRGLIDIDLVEDLLANRVIWWWDFWGPISEALQPIVGDPKMHDHTRFLYHVMMQRQQQSTAVSP